MQLYFSDPYFQNHLAKTFNNCYDIAHRILTGFYTPVWKTGRIMPWQCPSVCPSVRPSVRVFRTFLQHALRYQFETWYIHSVGGKTCRVWVASQLGQFDLVYSQKLVKPIFCNHGLINQDKFFKFGTQVACCILLDISSGFCKNIIFRILAIIFVRFGFFEVFRAFFLHVLRYQFETWYVHAVGGVTRQVRVAFQSGHFDLLYSQK